MKTSNYTLRLLFLALLSLYLSSCQSQIKFNNAEQEADSLALQVNSHNERVRTGWAKTISLYNQRNASAEEMIIMLDKITNGSTAETKELSMSLNKFKTMNQSDELLLNEKLFNTLVIQLEDILQKLSQLFIMAHTRKINNQSFLELQAKIEGLENRITVQRMIFNEEARSYNLKIEKNANNKFYEKYPNLGIKCYYKPNNEREKAAPVDF